MANEVFTLLVSNFAKSNSNLLFGKNGSGKELGTGKWTCTFCLLNTTISVNISSSFPTELMV